LCTILLITYIILISISFFSPTGHHSELETKYSNLFKLTERLTSPLKNKRPNCEQILEERNLWALSSTELMRNKDFKIPSENIEKIEDSFHLFFIKTKLKFESEINSSNNRFYFKYNLLKFSFITIIIAMCGYFLLMADLYLVNFI